MSIVKTCLRPGVLAWTSFLVLAALWAGAVRGAVEYQWHDEVGGEFGDPANWTPAGGPPGADDTALFVSDATYTVTFAADVANTNVWVKDGTVTFDLGGFTYSLTLDSPPIRIEGAVGQSPVLSVTNGLLTAELGGGGNRRMTIGNALNTFGALVITDGGKVHCGRTHLGAASTGTSELRVDGPGSEWHANSWVEVNGQSRLVVTNNADVKLVGLNACGSANSRFDLSVSGAGTTVDISYLNFGRRGSAYGRIADGAVVTTFHTAIAQIHADAVAVMTVTGAGSKLTHTRRRPFSLEIGADSSSGTLIVEDGGLVETDDGSGTRVEILSPGGVLRGAGGTVSARRSGGFGVGEIYNAGLVAPGSPASTGVLTLIGQYTQAASGTLRIKIAGTDPAAHDRLMVQENDSGDGDVFLDGTLELVYVDGILHAGSVDVLVTEGEISGVEDLDVVFDTEALPGGLPITYEWSLDVVSANETEILRFTLVAPPRGTLILMR